jgi:ABC-type antimicrobial peptide transport system permease subunit
MKQSLDLATALPRTMMTLQVGFAAVTLGMAILGLGGVMAYTVSCRRREIGLRIALGARRGEISREILRDSARLIGAGCLIGTAGAVAGARLLESLLFGVRPHDAVVMASAPALLAVVALLACMSPARRAASIDPMLALRQE